MHKVKEPVTEPFHRKTFKDLTRPKKRKKFPRRRLLVDKVRNSDFSINVIELEVKALGLELEIAKLKLNEKMLESEFEWSSSDSDGEHELMYRSLRHQVSNDLPASETMNNKFELKEFNIAVMNPGGLASKTASITNAIHKHDIRAVIISETHTAGKTIPVLDNTMKPFFHNRSEKANKGGVAIFLENTLAEHAVVIGKSVGDHEWLAVKVNYFDPPLVIIALYGCQTSKNSVSEMRRMWDELWTNVKSYAKHNTVLLCGDFNAAVGKRFNLVNNCNSGNQNGRLLAEGLKSTNLKILNGLYAGDQRTHIDRSSDSVRCLDYIVTNNPKACTRVVIDNDYLVTPYKVTNAKKGVSQGTRKYTDHKTIVTSLNLEKKADAVCERPPPVVVKDEAGHVKYYEFTDALADTAVDLLNSGKKILEVYKILMRKLKECESLSYLKIHKTGVKRKLWSDNEIFLKLTCELEKQASRVEGMKTSDRIFKTRAGVMLGERNQELFAMFDDQGSLVEDKESILAVLTDYNKNLLSRVPHPEHCKELFQAKKDIVELLDETVIEEFNTITPRDFVRAVQRVMNKGKAMFAQFLRMSPKLLAVLYFVFKKMYEEEVIPDDFIETLLIALHKKGDQRLASNYRFLHMRKDMSRFFQLLVYLKLESHFDTHTHESQMGGKKGCDTIEHLTFITSAVKAREEKGEGIIGTAADMVKCFDRSFLSDNHAILQLEGGDRKALKVLHKYQKENVIRVAGCDNTFTITNGMGQGGIPDARVTTSGITEATVRHMSKMPEDHVFVHREEKVTNLGYIDDTLLTSDNPTAAGIGSKLYGDALDELAMGAHPVKSVQVVMGNKDWRDTTREALAASPSLLQGFPLKTSAKERYLGFLLIDGSYREMIDANIRDKSGKMMAAAVHIRNLCNMPIIRRMGKSYAQKLMAMAQVAPVCQYGTQAWIDIQEDQYKAIEDAFHRSLTTILSVPANTNYNALLRVCELPHMENFVDCVKLKCWNWKLNVKRKGIAYRLLLNEIVNKTENGLAQDLANLCQKYGLTNILERYVSPEVITKRCKEVSYWKQWKANLTLRTVPLAALADKQTHWFHELPYNLSRGMVMLHLGLLLLKTQQPHMILRRNMAHKDDRTCLAEMCGESDSWQHMLDGCPFFVTRLVDTGNPVLDTAKFIDNLSAERLRRYGQGLVMFGNGEHELANTLLDSEDALTPNNKAREWAKEILTRFDNSQNLRSTGVPVSKVLQKRVIVTLSQACIKSLQRVMDAESGRLSAVPPVHGGWQYCSAYTTKVLAAGSQGVMRGESAKSQKREKTVTWEEFRSSIESAVVTKGSKLRSCKRITIMSDGKPKFVMENGDTKVETYVNDIGLHPDRMVGVTHMKETQRGTITFGVRDTVLTQIRSKDNGQIIESVTFELERDLLIVKADDEKSVLDKMENLSTPGTHSSIGLNRGFAEDGDNARRSGSSTPSLTASASAGRTSSPRTVDKSTVRTT